MTATVVAEVAAAVTAAATAMAMAMATAMEAEAEAAVRCGRGVAWMGQGCGGGALEPLQVV